jgi:hypothetical protein
MFGAVQGGDDGSTLASIELHTLPPRGSHVEPSHLPQFRHPHRRRRHVAGQRRVRPGRRYHQGRHPAFSVGHDGHIRNVAQGRGADGDRRNQCQGRRAGQKTRAGGGRSRLELAAVRRKSAWPDCQGQGRCGVRLLDVGIAQVGPARGERAQRPAVLPGPVRRGRAGKERVLYRRRAQPASHSGAGIPASYCSEPTTSIRAQPTRSCAPTCRPKASGRPTSRNCTPRSAMPITRPSSPTSRNSPQAEKPP